MSVVVDMAVIAIGVLVSVTLFLLLVPWIYRVGEGLFDLYLRYYDWAEHR